MCSPFRQMLAGRPCGPALQPAKQNVLSASLRGPHCGRAGTPRALLVLFLYLLCATSVAHFFKLEISFFVFENICDKDLSTY